MLHPAALGYDRALTVFAPDGRLYQVEYATEAVRRGMTVVGIRVSEGVVLGGFKTPTFPLVDVKSFEKVVMIDDHIGAAFTGLWADGRVLIDYARRIAQVHRVLYDDEIDVEVLTRFICDIKQAYTQHAGFRPFGVAILFGGVDRRGPQLFCTEPSGAYTGCKAVAKGAEESRAMEILVNEYKENMSIEDAIKLAIKVLVECGKSIVENVQAEYIEIGYVDVKTRTFKKLSDEVLEKYYREVGGGG